MDLEKILTKRQYEILSLRARGKTTQAIAKEKAISVVTVKTHLSEIYNRTGIPVNSKNENFSVAIKIILLYWQNHIEEFKNFKII